MKKYILLICSLASMNYSCKKDKIENTPVTQPPMWNVTFLFLPVNGEKIGGSGTVSYTKDGSTKQVFNGSWSQPNPLNPSAVSCTVPVLCTVNYNFQFIDTNGYGQPKFSASINKSSFDSTVVADTTQPQNGMFLGSFQVLE